MTGMNVRLLYVPVRLTEAGKGRLEEAGRLRVCAFHWTPLVGRKRLWCRGVSCYWEFQMNPEWSHFRDWKRTRALVMRRDGGRCVNCGAEAKEVDHIVEIQHGGPEFDPSNLRSLCHECHRVKTGATRRWRSSAMAESELRSRVLVKPLEGFS